ncbi:hypothetical protein CL689_06915 [Candidatus Saccharibacteria bacterium]|nr:hypothetical protein [Candidatus Saccharibacteria bacterium]
MRFNNLSCARIGGHTHWVRLAYSFLFILSLAFFGAKSNAAVEPHARPIDASMLENYQHVSVVFSAADLSNPESVFGHVFIVFHNAEIPNPLDPVVEFYGMMSEVEMGMLKTVASSIPGVYKLSTFEEKVRVYDKEGRDLFVRRTRSSINPRDLAGKIGRLSKGVHPYDFLDRNCAFYLEYLLTSSERFSDASWAIRQPADVFYEYGDPLTEYAIKSTERRRIEFKQALYDGRFNANQIDELRLGLKFYEARSVVLAGSVSSDLDSSAVAMFDSPPPQDVYPAPKAAGHREYAAVAISKRGFLLQYGGFDTRGLSTNDSVPSLSRLKVGEVTLRCNKGDQCASQVLAFETLTLPKEGFGLSKFLSTSGRLDQEGVGVNAQIGMGIGYRSGSLGVAVVPGLGVDNKYWSKRSSLTDGLLANRLVFTYLHARTSTYLDLMLSDTVKIDPIGKQKRSLQITFDRQGLFFRTSFADDFLLGVQRRFD